MINYRTLATDSIVSQLADLNISIQDNFTDKYDSPEEHLNALFAADKESQSRDQAYLLLFELWRRTCGFNQSISLFCDELDHQIDLYHAGDPEGEWQIPNLITEVRNLLVDLYDQGEDAQNAFKMIEAFSSHNLDEFLYDYIADLLCDDFHVEASDLYDAFTPFVKNTLWFELLHVEILAKKHPIASQSALCELFDKLDDEQDLNFLFEVAEYLIHSGDHQMFLALSHKIVNQIHHVRDLTDLIYLCIEYFSRIDDLERQKIAEKMLHHYSNIDQDRMLSQHPDDIRLVQTQLGFIHTLHEQEEV